MSRPKHTVMEQEIRFFRKSNVSKSDDGYHDQDDTVSSTTCTDLSVQQSESLFEERIGAKWLVSLQSTSEQSTSEMIYKDPSDRSSVKSSDSKLMSLDSGIDKHDFDSELEDDRSRSIVDCPSDDEIKKLINKHNKIIVNNLNPKQLFQLYSDFDLNEILIDTSLTRSKKAQLLIDEVHSRSAYSKFLCCLTEDNEHMGHKYIVSLLRGTKFADDEVIAESRKLLNSIQQDLTCVEREINVTSLVPHLMEQQLITLNESEDLQLPRTRQDKAQILLTYLKSKGPTAHFIFVRNCLSVDKVHQDLYHKITTQPINRKRPNMEMCTKVTKRKPQLLELPKGLTTDKYIKLITTIRQYHQTGGEKWQLAEEICMKKIRSPHTPLEVKISLLLESCITFMYDSKNDDLIFDRVDRARKMCTELSEQQGNTQALEGRCSWVLAKLYRFRKEYKKAQSHLGDTFSLIHTCDAQEDKLLASYQQACVLLDQEMSPSKQKQAINNIKYTVSCACEEDYGLKLSTYSMIRIAQANIGSCAGIIGKSPEKVPASNRQEAIKVLNDIEQEIMPPRTECMYLYTKSDALRINGQLEEAKNCADRALTIAREENLTFENDLVNLRLQALAI